jgi:choloylglycine hydrolase
MCTSITFLTSDCYMGRNLDLEYSFGEQVVVTPRNYVFSFHREKQISHHYAMIGMANVADNYPLYAEAANEHGLYMAGLNFPDNAFYAQQDFSGEYQITPYELIPWILGTCQTVRQACERLKKTQMIGIPFAEGYPLAPLHWHLADRTESVVIEPMQDGLHIYDDPVGVLTNNPPYPYHRMNLNQYQNLTSRYAENRFSNALDLHVYGQGMGAIGLPGDVSPMSRFVKAAFLKWNSVCEYTEEASVSQFFHILDAVSMVRGSVITQEGNCDITTYSCCMNATQGIYYYKTYQNNQITAIHLFHEDLDADQLKVFPLITSQQIHCCN